ncbi:hypothetical protein JHK87_004295 [Glycine soja]|nr:hypothetical protein JHK87_004295 [Glycine soja]
MILHPSLVATLVTLVGLFASGEWSGLKDEMKEYELGKASLLVAWGLFVKKHLKNGKNVSMGLGFVEFDAPEIATNVRKDLQNDGQKQKTTKKDKSSTKLLKKNVAFEATEKDLPRST